MPTGQAVAKAPDRRDAMLATQPTVHIPEHHSNIGRERVFTLPRVASLIAVGLIPVGTLFLQPSTFGLITASALELVVAAVAFKAWLPRET
jgi:hypothetical protein